MIGIFLSLIAVVLLFLFFTMNEIPSFRAYAYIRKIPGEAGWPIVGNIFTMLAMETYEILDYIEMLFKKYQRLSRFDLAGVLCVFLREAEDIQVVIGNVYHIKKGREYVPLEPWLREGLLTSFGKKWAMRRKLLTPTFHFKILKDSVENINRNSKVLAQNLLMTRSREVKVSNYVIDCAMDIIGESAMGIRMEAQTGVGKDYVKSIKTACTCMAKRILTMWQHKLWLFTLSQNGRQFFKSLKILHDFTKKIVQERKVSFKKEAQKRDEDNEHEGKVRRVFLDSLLEMQQQHPEALTDQDICEEVDTFMFEGHDTVSTAISFTLFILGCHPREQKLAAEEIEEIFQGSEREITMDDIHKMVYLDKVIKETLRIYPSVPYMSRFLTQDCVLQDGLVLPAGTNVVIPTFLVHRNERFFPDPEKFDPERFSEEECLARHPYAYLPFSAGPRNCIGQKFAVLEMKITLANILRSVRIESVTKPGDFKVEPTFILKPTIPLICKFHKK